LFDGKDDRLLQAQPGKAFCDRHRVGHHPPDAEGMSRQGIFVRASFRRDENADGQLPLQRVSLHEDEHAGKIARLHEEPRPANRIARRNHPQSALAHRTDARDFRKAFGERGMKTVYKLIALAIVFVAYTNTTRAEEYTFTNGVVFAKIIGPNKWTKETAESKFDAKGLNYFYTTIEIVSTEDDFLQELKGRKVKVRSDDFDKTFLGKTVAVHLERRTDKAGKTQFIFDCSDLRLSMMVAEWKLKKQK
jgi:hypothetical protein